MFTYWFVHHFFVVSMPSVLHVNNKTVQRPYCVSLSTYSSPEWDILRLGCQQSLHVVHTYVNPAFTVNFFLKNLIFN
jgi:hypothetical protein